MAYFRRTKTLNPQGGGLLMKRVSVIAILLCFLIPAVVGAADLGKRDIFTFGEAKWISDNEVTVSISVTHDENLVAMDIPLEWSKGVTLTNVSFANTRVDYFDAKIANIDEENSRVLIGLISMVYERKDELKPGDGVIAELTFRVDDATLEQFEITPFEATNPGHSLALVYNNWSTGKPIVDHVNPQVEGNTVLLSKNPGDGVQKPTAYALGQNFPNPFNPSTTLLYSLKNAGHVQLNIYNVLGQNVRTLVDEYQAAKDYSVIWDGHDDAGNEVASGVYFYRIKSGEFTDIKKMVLMK
jgi:hypothetical protein